MIHKAPDKDTYWNCHDGRNKTCDRRTDARYVAYGFHGHGPQVAEQKAYSEELQGKKGEEDDNARVICIVEQQYVEQRYDEIGHYRGIDDSAHAETKYQGSV